MTTHTRSILVGAAVLALATTAPAHATHETAGWPEHFTALAANVGGLTHWRWGIVDILVVSWSTRVEKDQLAATVRDDGPVGLLNGLREMPRLGFIRTPNNVAYNVRFAWEETSEDGGRRIVLATDRALSLWKETQIPSIDYPFTVIEIRINAEGEGEGKMSLTTRVVANSVLNLIELEHYATEPARLTSVRSVTRPVISEN